jgi:hypothetical protein
MKLVIVESPYAAYTQEQSIRNLLYLDCCLRDSILRGESPYASHKIIPGALDDDEPSQRDLGIKCGYEWWRAASLIAFYVDLGWSQGMIDAYRLARTKSIKTVTRSLDNEARANSNPYTDDNTTPH